MLKFTELYEKRNPGRMVIINGALEAIENNLPICSWTEGLQNGYLIPFNHNALDLEDFTYLKKRMEEFGYEVYISLELEHHLIVMPV